MGHVTKAVEHGLALIDAGASVRHAAAQAGVSPSALSRARARLGLPHRPPGARQKLPLEDRQRAGEIVMARTGADKVSVSPSGLVRWKAAGTWTVAGTVPEILSEGWTLPDA